MSLRVRCKLHHLPKDNRDNQELVRTLCKKMMHLSKLSPS
jgi:hypothetical protein